MRTTRRWTAAGVALALIGATVLAGAVPATAAPDDAEFTTFTKVVTPPDTSPYAAGEQFSYSITMTCNSPIVDVCVNARVDDTLPEPLVFDPTVPNPVVVSGGGTPVITVDGTAFNVRFNQTGTAGTGLITGQQVNISVFVQVPADAPADFDGSITNEATAAADNALPKDATAVTELDIPEDLDSTVTKSVDDHVGDGATVPALPDQPVDYTIGGGNASNRSVDEIVVQDPADGIASPFDGYLDFTGVESITPPAGADQVQIEYLDPDGDWVVAYPTGAIPATPWVPEVDPLSDVKGLRFTFSSSTGQLPPTPAGAEAAIGISSRTNDQVLDIPLGDSEDVPNTASSNVVVEDRTSEPQEADGDVVISNTGPTVEVEKSFADDTLLAGDSTTANIDATNGPRPVTSMTITEPTAGQPDLGDQGLTFDGFTDGVVWPQNADAASITYTYADGTSETLDAAPVNTLPEASEPSQVVGFAVTFTGPIQANASANLPFEVTAQPVDGQIDVVSTNQTTADVTDATGQTGTDAATADSTRQPARVSTVITKNIVRDDVWDVPGSTSTVSFIASVNDQGENASTVGSDSLVISDPAGPQPGDPPSAFWNTFDAKQISAGVPADADLTVQYWDGEEWATLPGAELIEGPEPSWSYSIPTDLQDEVQGIRFIYTPKPGALLPPGFQVSPSLQVATRDQFRDGSGSVHDAAEAAGPLVVPNDASSTVESPNDTSPEDDTATDGDQIDVNPFDPDTGADLIEKHWLEDSVDAFTEDERPARISWSTEGLPFDSVTITDDPTAGPAYAPADLAASVFDAWDLVAIDPIDSTLDPSIVYDRISEVLLHDGTDWVDVTEEACGSADTTGTACDGGFPGYTLSDDERASTVAVQLVYVEGSGRGGGSGPAPGSGVAASYDHDRNLDLVFRLRDAKRSDGGPVVGTLHDETYNSGLAGVVDNTVGIEAEGPQPVSQTDADDITILDTVINTSVTKSFDQDSLPIPPENADQGVYPLVTATLRGVNETEADITRLTVSDPASTPNPPTPPPAETTTYDYLNLYRIESITVPDEATSSVVTLTREGGDTTDYSIDEALALSPTDLDDVIGFSVSHTAPGEVQIHTQASTTVMLTYQLREFLRDEPAVRPTPGDTVENVASSDALRPGGDPDLDEAWGTATDSIALADATYGVQAGKSLSPDSRYEDEPRDGYTVGIGGQPTGNVRTTVMTITDDRPTFWNAFEFTAFESGFLPLNLHQLRVSALVGVEYALDGTDLVQTCAGDADLTACWVVGDWQDAAGNGAIVPALPAGVAPEDVRGVRFEVRADADESLWEQPSNPIVSQRFTVERLEDLRYGPNGEIDSYPVPSTLPGLETAPGETVQGTTTDVVDVHADGAWENPDGDLWEADANAQDTTQLLHRPNSIKVEKSPGNGQGGANAQQFPPDSEIPYVIRITNTGQWQMTGLELTDQIGTDASGSYLVPVPGADPVFEFALTDAGGDPLPTDGFSGSLDPATGVVTITVPDDFVFAPGDVLVISAHLQFRGALAPGTPVSNTVGATSDRDFETCEHTSDNVPITETQNVAECSSDTSVTPQPAAPIGVTKAVKGVGAGVPGAAPGDPNFDDLGVLDTNGSTDGSACALPNAGGGYYTNRCVPITRPGGVEEWRINFTNRGNVPADVIGGIDVFPAVGDTGVVVGTPRGSQWSPVFLGNFGVSAGMGIFAYYTTTVPSRACNATDIQYSVLGVPVPETDPCFADIAARGWTPYDNSTPKDELAAAVATKLVIEYPDGQELAPGATGVVTFQMQTPEWIPDAYDDELPIAWNTVAAGSRATFQGQPVYQGPVEPVRAGVAFPNGEIRLVKSQEAPDTWTFPLPDSYEFDPQCTSGGEAGDLVDSAGDPVSPVTVPADGTPVLVGPGTTLPLFAECTVAELPAQGSTVGYDPPGVDGRSGEVVATADYGGRDDIAHPFPADPIEDATVTVTNDYAIGGFSIEKAVAESGAVDQDGDPIASDPEFSFTASCEWLGTDVVAPEDREFTLQAGESKDFTPLPVGADCTVTETDAAGATTTTTVVTEDGVEGGPVEGPVEFTILPDEQDGTHLTAIAVTNAYTVGSLALTKDVTGDGAGDWAPDSFIVQVVCEWDQATSNPVYADTITISDGQTVTIDDLPTGATCDITEPEDGGATEITILPETVTIGVEGDAGDPVTVSVTNDFRVGGFVVEKTLEGSGVGFSEDVDFTFSYTCTYELQVVASGELTITGDGTVGPLDSDVVDGLPVGAICQVTETDDGGADGDPPVLPVSVTIPDVVEGVAQVATVAYENRFSAGTIAVTKALEGTASTVPEIVDATYTVHVTCSLTADGGPVFEGDVEVTGGETVTVTDPATGDPLLLPTGTHCWGAESDDAGATSSSVDFDSFDDAAIVVASDSDDPQTLELTVTNVFEFGEISIVKSIDGNSDHAAGFTFEILVTCTLDRGDGNAPIVIYDQESVELQGGEDATLSGIPIGSECWAEEPDSHGATDVVISATEDDPVVVDGSGVITITVTNLFPDAGFTVTKAVDAGGAVNQDGDPIAYDTVFSFTAVCEFQGATVLDETFDLADGDEQTYDTLPAGSECTVTETDQGGAATSIVLTQADVETDLGAASEAVFTLAPDAEGAVVTTVAVTNAFTVGSVELTKLVTGTGADAWGGTFGDFDVELVCTLDAADPDVVYDATHTLTKDAPGDVWLVENLPTGASCTVTETDDGAATESTVTPTEFVVGDDGVDGPVTVSIENEFRTGGLNVLKAVTGPGVPAFSNGPFEFSVVCTYDGRTVVDDVLIVTGDGTEGPFLSETIGGIPVGAVCVVTETFDADADTTPPPVTITITDQEVDGVETVVTTGFLNVFSLGTIEVTKLVDGSAADEAYVRDAVFTVQVTCQIQVRDTRVTLFDGPVEIRAGETALVLRDDGDPLKLPYRTHCFGAETDAAGATSMAIDLDSFDNAAVIDVADAPQLISLTATNTFEEGSIELEKTVSGAIDQADGKTFVVAVTCVLDRGAANEPYVAFDAEPVSIVAGETVTLTDLPIGTECWAEETETGGAIGVRVSATEATPVVVGLDEVVKITVDNEFAAPPPVTGVDGAAVWAWIGLGGALLAFGAAMVLLARRSRRAGRVHESSE